MPKATVSTETVRKELKSLTGGYVELRKMGFGSRLKRRDTASRMVMEMEQNSGRRGQKREVPQEMKIEMMQEASRRVEFRECIVDHNLEDDNGNKLDFSNPMTLDALDPTVGEEIEQLIDELHPEVPDDFLTGSSNAASQSIPKTKELETNSA